MFKLIASACMCILFYYFVLHWGLQLVNSEMYYCIRVHYRKPQKQMLATLSLKERECIWRLLGVQGLKGTLEDLPRIVATMVGSYEPLSLVTGTDWLLWSHPRCSDMSTHPPFALWLLIYTLLCPTVRPREGKFIRVPQRTRWQHHFLLIGWAVSSESLKAICWQCPSAQAISSLVLWRPSSDWGRTCPPYRPYRGWSYAFSKSFDLNVSLI
jgi:hypothetical protein